MNRMVVIGYEVTSPTGNNADSFLNSLKEGADGIAPITKFDASGTRIALAGEVKDLPYDKYFTKKDSRRTDMSSIYGIYAVLEAMEISGLDKEKTNQDRFGVIIGSGIGGLPTIRNQVIHLHEEGTKQISPMFTPMVIANMAAENIALRVGAKGICTAIVTACASGMNSIDETLRNTRHNYSDVILTGRTEVTVCEMGIAGLTALTALPESANPDRGLVPFDENRSGFVMGGGAGVLVLESLEHAQACGTRIYGEIVGYGVNCNVYHMTTPTPDSSGVSKAMKLTMEEAGVQPEQVGYINAHGMSTPTGDQAEVKAIQPALGENFRDIYVSSARSMTGYLLRIASGTEVLATLMTLEHQFTPPTINVEKQDSEINLTVVRDESKSANFTYTMSNSLGLGGCNAALYMKRWEE